MKNENLSGDLIKFVNILGNLMLPGSIQPMVPSWSAQPPSDDFLASIGKFHEQIDSFKHFLEVKYGNNLTELNDEQMKNCILENSDQTKNFFQSLGKFYIQDYYSRPKTLAALGLHSEAHFPLGHIVLPSKLEMLEVVFNNGKKYR